MAPAAALPDASTADGYLLVLAILLPVTGILLSLVLGGRHAERIVAVVLAMGVAVAAAVLIAVWSGDAPLVYIVGGWLPPLGLALRADGLSAAMMMVTAIVVCATGLFARGEFSQPRGAPEERGPLVFWILLLAIWSALNAIVLGNDLFNLYVALELLTFAAVPLVCLKGTPDTIAAALRYILFALLGSVLYLLGAVLIYGAYGTLDIVLLSARVRSEPVAQIAGALMTMGLLAKTGLFPLHLWLPPAHAGAPAPGSAILSALVVKGSFFLIVRIWFDAMPGLLTLAAAQLLATLGAGAILVGSVLALRQQRLKLLIAYSTIAQIGYLFFLFPLAGGFQQGAQASAVAWTGGWLQLFSHAFAKAAMFMAAGLIAQAAGHDRISDLGGIGRVLPITTVAFGLAGLSLMGVPPSGGFVAKWLLLLAAVVGGQWVWAAVMLMGGLLAGGYILLVLGKLMGNGADASPAHVPCAGVSRGREMVVLAVALCAVALGLVPLEPSELLQIGRATVVEISAR
jgi:formate hydrogenlyase subunit 3/multisubunit Na+/H+ antiporter MnhD subunit